jgi:hypothetical protein
MGQTIHKAFHEVGPVFSQPFENVECRIIIFQFFLCLPSEGSHSLPTHSWFISPNARAECWLARGEDGDVNATISFEGLYFYLFFCFPPTWIASRSFSLCSGLLTPISRCISWSDWKDTIRFCMPF